MLVHRLAIVTPTDGGTVDADGMPVPGVPTVEPVRGLVQPSSARADWVERPSGVPGAGAQTGTHVIFLAPRAIAAGAWIRDEPDAGRRFDITAVRSYDFGRSPHLEIDAVLVTSEPLVTVP